METSISPTGDGPELVTSATPSIRIGRIDYRGLSVTAQALLVTYEQKLSVSGSIAPTIGMTSKGTGGVFSAGGLIGSHNESVATVVYVDRDGVENTAELPSNTSVRQGSVFRMDHLNGHRFAVCNLSGHQPIRWLRGAGSFISVPIFRKRHVLLIILALAAAYWSLWLWSAALVARPAWVLWRRTTRRAELKALSEYMVRITR